MKKIDMKLKAECSLPMIPMPITIHEGIEVLLSEHQVKGVNIKGEECTGTLLFITATPNWVQKNWESLLVYTKVR